MSLKKVFQVLFVFGVVVLMGFGMQVFAQPTIPQALTYYVSSSQGDDANDGLSENKPFKTLSKVNELDLGPGDQVLFRCGDTWQAEQMILSKSGSESAPILFSSFPTGCANKPVFSGSKAVSGWSLVSGDIYEATLSLDDFPLGVNQLFRDGRRLTLGRWPNLDEGEEGYAFIDDHTVDKDNTGKEFSDHQLPTGIDWTGAIVHLKNIRWSLINRRVDASSGSLLTVNKKFSCLISNWGDCIGWGYFLNNHFATLDQDGEWYYDAAAGKVYLVSSTGIPKNIEASIVLDVSATLRHGGIMLSDGSATAYVIIDNLEIKNWFNHGIGTPASMDNDIYHHITLRNLDIKDVDSSGIRLSSSLDDPPDGRDGRRGGHHLTFENNLIDGANHFGITGFFAESTFEGNQIRNIGLIENLGESGMGCGLASEQCTEFGDGLRIRQDDVLDSGYGNLLWGNRFEKTGYNGVDVFGPENTLERNFITQACYSKDDCAGVRVYGNINLEETDMVDVKLIDNIITDIPGNVDGCHESLAAFGMGIYIDHYAKDVEARGNTVISTTVTGILYQRSTGTITDNTVYNASTGTEYSAQLGLAADSTQAVVTGNILYGLNEEAWTLYASSLDNLVASDFNYLFHPFIDEQIAFGPSWTRYTFPGWQAYSGLDARSRQNWFTLNPGDAPRSQIIYNDTQSTTTLDLGVRKYLDLNRNEVVGTITLAPFKSKILIDDGEAGLAIASITPNIWKIDDAADFILSVQGAGFTTNSVVHWNGSDRPTTFLSANRLTAKISAADVSSVGYIPVTVFEPDANPVETLPLFFRVVEYLHTINLPFVAR